MRGTGDESRAQRARAIGWAIAVSLLATGCSCGPAAPIALLPDGSVGVPVPTENNVYTCRCVCEVPITRTTQCAPWAPERMGRVGGPNEGELICELGRQLEVCFPPLLNVAHAQATRESHTPTNAELFADCDGRVGLLAEETMRSIYQGCGRPNPDGSCPSSECQIDCECGAVLVGGDVGTSTDAKCNSVCPLVPYDRFTGDYGNVEQATYVEAPNRPDCALAEDTPVVCRPPQLDPPELPPDGLLSGLFGAEPGEITSGHGAITINDEARVPVTIGGALSTGIGPCVDCVLPLSLAVDVGDVVLPGRGELTDLTMHGAVLPPGVPIDADGLGLIPPESFLATVHGVASRTELGITFSERRAYFVPNPSPMSLEIDPVARTFALRSQFFATLDASTSATFELELGGTFERVPPVADAGPDRVVECTSPAGALIELDASASTDGDGDIIAHRWTAFGPPAPVELGGTPAVSLTQPFGARTYWLGVSDATMALGGDEVTVEVVDAAGPSLGVEVDPACLWPPNHRMVRLRLGEELAVTVADACSEWSATRIVAVSSNQLEDGAGDGATAPDVRFGPSGVCLRAERAPMGGEERIYTITIEASDSSGNTTREDVVVRVPHDRREGCAALDASLLVEETDLEAGCTFEEIPGVTVPLAVTGRGAGEPEAGADPGGASFPTGGGLTCAVSETRGGSELGVLLLFGLATLLARRRRREPARLAVTAALIVPLVVGCEAPRTVSTLAGGTTARYADGFGEAAGFREPHCITVDEEGILYVGDSLRVRRVSPAGEVTTLAGGGSGETGFTDGFGVDAEFYASVCVALGEPDQLLVADTGNHAIRAVRISTGAVTTILGGARGYMDGAFEEARFDSPRTIVYDRARRLAYIYETGAVHIRVLDFNTETVRTLAGSGLRGYADGVGTEASFWSVGDMALDGDGGLLVSDTFNRVIRHVTAEGVVTTIAGVPETEGYAEGQGDQALFRAPGGIVAAGPGRFYVTDAVAAVVREITLDGTTRWIAGRPLIEGRGELEGNDGPDREATFRIPGSLAVAPDGRIYVQENYRIRIIE